MLLSTFTHFLGSSIQHLFSGVIVALCAVEEIVCTSCSPGNFAISEALVFAAKAGADPAKVRQALMGGFASSRILEVHGERLLKRNFAPGFRIELHQKDLGLALEGAKTLGISLPNTATCQELFNACVANGLAKSDHSAMVRALELLANFTIDGLPPAT
jgi:2-hydroxy-3-oxopropionate reductase